MLINLIIIIIKKVKKYFKEKYTSIKTCYNID